MSINPIDTNDSAFIRLDIHGGALLTDELIVQFDAALTRAEDLGAAGVMFVHIRGTQTCTEELRWPGTPKIQLVNKWERLLRRLERSSAATLVFSEHSCSALALELLLVADIRLITGDMRIQTTDRNLGAWPSMASYRLTHQVGYARARRLILFSGEISASSASELGIADIIISNSEEALDHAKHLLTGHRLDLPVRRRLLLDSMSTSYEDALGAHLAACDRFLRQHAQSSSKVTNSEGTMCTS